MYWFRKEWLFWRKARRGVAKMSLALEQPQTCTGEQETLLGLLGPPPEKGFRGTPGIRGLYQAIRVARLAIEISEICFSDFLQKVGQNIGGRKVYTKGVLSSEKPSPSAGQERVLVYTKIACFQGKRRENIYTKEPSRCLRWTSSHSTITHKMIGHPQACVYPDACLRSDIVSGNAPLLGQGIWWTPLPLPLPPKESVGCHSCRAEALCIYQGPCPGRGTLPDTSPIS